MAHEEKWKRAREESLCRKENAARFPTFWHVLAEIEGSRCIRSVENPWKRLKSENFFVGLLDEMSETSERWNEWMKQWCEGFLGAIASEIRPQEYSTQ